jgi:hypothetical protein
MPIACRSGLIGQQQGCAGVPRSDAKSIPVGFDFA